MIGIQFFIGVNGQPTLIEDMEGLRTLHNLLGLVLNSEQSSMTNPPTIPNGPTTLDGFKPPVETAFPELNRVPMRTPVGETAKDYARKAWAALGRPSQAREIAAKMIELGWKTKSKTATTVLSSARGAMTEVGFTSLGNGLWELPVEQDPASNANGTEP